MVEVLQSKICPDRFADIYTDFQRFQHLAWDTLLAFHDVCEQNDIKYQLAFGSLLGAIRDDGQIPWDYDVDVFVFAEDRSKLVNALSNDLNAKYYFDCVESNPACCNELIRICPKGYRTEALHVDVFFLVGTPEDEQAFCEFTKRLRFLVKARIVKLSNIEETFAGRPKIKLIRYLKRLKFILCDENKWHGEYLDLCKKYSVYKVNKCVNANSNAGKYFIPCEYIRETKLIEVNNTQLRVPVRYEELLTLLFKDYMSVPALDIRIAEVLKHYKKLKRYEEISHNV